MNRSVWVFRAKKSVVFSLYLPALSHRLPSDPALPAEIAGQAPPTLGSPQIPHRGAPILVGKARKSPCSHRTRGPKQSQGQDHQTATDQPEQCYSAEMFCALDTGLLQLVQGSGIEQSIFRTQELTAAAQGQHQGEGEFLKALLQSPLSLCRLAMALQ